MDEIQFTNLLDAWKSKCYDLWRDSPKIDAEEAILLLKMIEERCWIAVKEDYL